MPIVKILDEQVRSVVVTDNWVIRRRWMKWFLFISGANVEALICWVIYAGGNAYGVQILLSLLTAIVSVLMFYIFGAVYDDHSKRRWLGETVGVTGGDAPADAGDDKDEGDAR